MRPNETLRGDSEDEFLMDKLCKTDWNDFGETEKEPKVVEEDGGEKESE